MKRTVRKKEDRVLAITAKVTRGIGRLATSAQRQVVDKGEYVAGKVNQALGRIERSTGK